MLSVARRWASRIHTRSAAATNIGALCALRRRAHAVRCTARAHVVRRHYIARIQGQPLNIGVFIDSTYDIGRIENVHFNPW